MVGTTVPAGDGVGFRFLEPADTALLERATLLNVNWDRAGFTAADVRSDARLAHYALLDPDRGDMGIVATADGGWVGVVWLLFLPAEDPGYGFVAPGVPELSICVVPGHRRRSVGTRLTEQVLAVARERGIGAVSLSVGAGNGARALYERFGFRDVPGGSEGTMVLHL